MNEKAEQKQARLQRDEVEEKKQIEVHEMKKAIFEIEKIILDVINNRL